MTNVLKKAYNATWGKYVFAGLYDKFLARVEQHGLSEKRAEMLAPAYGKTIELGTGTGLNLLHYPDAVTDLVLTEPYPPMVAKLEEKVRDYPKRVQLTVAGAEKLPFDDGTFDTVAAAMILCTVRDPDVVLAEIERVLKPGGQYLFLEHVRNPDPKVARKQDIIQKGWYWFGNECHCNRPTLDTLSKSSLEIVEIKETKMPGAWEFIEAMAIGRAVRQDKPANGKTSAKPAATVKAATGGDPACNC
ncbi:class I SAM-dependent methyltransferase [Amycolatopsis sp. H6(2020)]|nr:class I SAM-dependent methyltransferase [Amycolatopsis sp. H6(2020)]